jgi:hypothetical protein
MINSRFGAKSMSSSDDGVDLKYKEHHHFFETYFRYKDAAFTLKSGGLNDPKMLIEAFKATITLIDYTSNYISDLATIDKKITTINDLLMKKNNIKAWEELGEVLRLINQEHENCDLLPKKNKNDKPLQEFWRSENNRALREIKKAFTEVLGG